MSIVPRYSVFLYGFMPKYPLLAAPPERKRLCAPKIAGLLPAATQSAPPEPRRGDILID
jgi:hypothetical protein